MNNPTLSGSAQISLHLGCIIVALRRGQFGKLGFYFGGIVRALR